MKQSENNPELSHQHRMEACATDRGTKKIATRQITYFDKPTMFAQFMLSALVGALTCSATHVV